MTKITPSGNLLTELRGLIEQARQHVALTVNSTLTMLYWKVGERIRREVLDTGRAEYGNQILATLSQELVKDYGKGFNPSALTRMIKFSEVFPDENIVATLSRELSWSHFVELLPLDQPLQRDFYAEMCRIERWSVRTLRERIGSQLYLRTAIAKKPAAVVQAEISHLRAGRQMTPDMVFRDPYIYDRTPGEESPIGLILCAGADAEQVELMDLGAANIRVAEYKQHIPGIQLLQQHLHRSVELAREGAAQRLQVPHQDK